MMTRGELSRLYADLASAESEEQVIDLLVSSLGALGTLQPRELETANERIADAISEFRALHEDD